MAATPARDAPIPERLHWAADPGIASVQRRTLRLLSASQIAGSIGLGAVPSVGIILAEQVTGSEGWAGVARTGGTVGAAALAVPLALLAVGRGRRISLSSGWLLAAFGSICLATAAILANGVSGRPAAIAVLVVGMLASGAGTATSLQSRYAAIDLSPPEHRSRHLSLVVWATTVGAVLGPNLGAPGEALSHALHIPIMAGPFVIAGVVQLAAAGVAIALRPDPLLLAASSTAGTGPSVPRLSVRRALAAAWRNPGARVALIAMCCAHAVMVGVMTMTPVHMDHYGASITLVGITISMHVLGMYAASPLVGAAADRFGRLPVILAGCVVLLAATAVAGTSGTSTVRVTIGLVLLGLGWSLCLVSASALLSESVPAAERTSVQGAADAGMNVAAAFGAAVSGPLLGIIGFGGLNALSAAIVLLAAPWVISALRRSRSAQIAGA